MKKKIDCLLIGYNHIPFQKFKDGIQSSNADPGVKRYFRLSYLEHEGQFHTIDSLFNICSNTDKKIDIGNRFSNTIAYLGSYLAKNGLSCESINAVHKQRQELIHLLTDREIAVIAITTTFYVTALPLLDLIPLIRQYNKDAKIVVGGPFVINTLAPEKHNNNAFQFLLNYINADFYIENIQGEATLIKLINAVKDGTPCGTINNLYYKAGNQFIATPVLNEGNRLEDTPVNWGLFRDQCGEMINVRTSLSCPFACSFCNFPLLAGKFQTLPVEAIEKELNAIHDLGNIKNIFFIDDTFNFPTKRFKDILRMMVKNKYGFRWFSFLRCQFLDKETVELMKEGGCEGVFLGIESGNQEILDNMNKSVRVEYLREGLRLLNKYQILTVASFVLGFLGETLDTVNDTIRFIEEGKPTFFTMHAWECHPKAPFWAKKEQFAIEGSGFKWSHKTMNSIAAFDMVEHMIMTVKNSVFLPDFNFDFSGVIDLLHIGFDMGQIKRIINCFNAGLKERIGQKAMVGTSPEIINNFRDACRLEKPAAVS